MIKKLFPRANMALLHWRSYHRNTCLLRSEWGRQRVKSALGEDFVGMARAILAKLGLALASDLKRSMDETGRWRSSYNNMSERYYGLSNRFEAYREGRAGRPVRDLGPGQAAFPLRAPRFPL